MEIRIEYESEELYPRQAASTNKCLLLDILNSLSVLCLGVSRLPTTKLCRDIYLTQ